MGIDQVDRTEYSMLATNNIIVNPIQFDSGYIKPPKGLGHGLSPISEKLVEFSNENLIIK